MYLYCKNDSTGCLCLVLWYCMERRFTGIRNRQYGQPRRLCCARLVHSVFAIPQPLLSASYCTIYCCSSYKFADTRYMPGYQVPLPDIRQFIHRVTKLAPRSRSKSGTKNSSSSSSSSSSIPTTTTGKQPSKRCFWYRSDQNR